MTDTEYPLPRELSLEPDGFHDAVGKAIASPDLFSYWQSDLTIKPGCTLGQLIKHIKPECDILEMLADCSIEPFLVEAAAGPAAEQTVEQIEAKKYLEIEKYKGTRTLHQRVDCNGRIKGDKELYALDFTPVTKLLNAELVLIETAELYEDFKLKDSFTVTITLGEYLTGLFSELCFHGAPKDRDERLQEIVRRADEAREHPEKMLSWEEVKDKIDKKLNRE